MKRKVQEAELSWHRKQEIAPGHHDAISQDEIDSALEAFRRLVQVAAATGRDWKFVDALLHTMVDLVLQTHGDLFVSAETPSETSAADIATAAPAETPTEPRLRVRPEYRLRLEAVIDSWSDDETADFLRIGARQVRRRAQHGALYYFVVNRKRRYPVWQFDRVCGVLEGVAQVGMALPRSWSAERVYTFMTSQDPALALVTPVQWLFLKRDPNSIVAAIAMFSET